MRAVAQNYSLSLSLSLFLFLRSLIALIATSREKIRKYNKKVFIAFDDFIIIRKNCSLPLHIFKIHSRSFRIWTKYYILIVKKSVDDSGDFTDDSSISRKIGNWSENNIWHSALVYYIRPNSRSYRGLCTAPAYHNSVMLDRSNLSRAVESARYVCNWVDDCMQAAGYFARYFQPQYSTKNLITVAIQPFRR